MTKRLRVYTNGGARGEIGKEAWLKRQREAVRLETRSEILTLPPAAETLVRAMAHYRACEVAAFEPTPSKRGRPHSYDLDAIAPAIRSFVVAQNIAGRPSTAQNICDEVAGVCGVCLSVPTINRALHELGLHHLKGENRHIYALSPGNVAFRRSHLEKKIANRRPVRGPKRGSKRTVRLGLDRQEVYLVESYGNVNHVTWKTWLTADKIRYGKSGRGAWYESLVLTLC
ncbi:hypothetical protein PR003_g11121 [Phytophthora rubi]|uniref:Uncharacterized protein n=1 Tax=Phytophthora rubi TaxID=129364 RepID=A0A6A4F3X2_9STRA|nr:hypothetical protein PR003_g11121 [Phytophthora rubi]